MAEIECKMRTIFQGHEHGNKSSASADASLHPASAGVKAAAPNPMAAGFKPALIMAGAPGESRLQAGSILFLRIANTPAKAGCKEESAEAD
ncbi:hypothetical protein LLG95_13915 [bacterium]|nr:hypothetical protein [bacterium]